MTARKITSALLALAIAATALLASATQASATPHAKFVTPKQLSLKGPWKRIALDAPCGAFNLKRCAGTRWERFRSPREQELFSLGAMLPNKQKAAEWVRRRVALYEPNATSIRYRRLNGVRIAHVALSAGSEQARIVVGHKHRRASITIYGREGGSSVSLPSWRALGRGLLVTVAGKGRLPRSALTA